MNTTQKSEIRRHLRTERERIVDEWERHSDEGGHGNAWDLRDPEERATQIANRDVSRKIADDAQRLLSKVDLALQRIDDGTYGECTRCGKSIPEARLLAKPSVSLCLACQEIKDTSKV